MEDVEDGFNHNKKFTIDNKNKKMYYGTVEKEELKITIIKVLTEMNVRKFSDRNILANFTYSSDDLNEKTEYLVSIDRNSGNITMKIEHFLKNKLLFTSASTGKCKKVGKKKKF